jgi:hypothetical protein
LIEPALLFVVGASGAGKTATVRALEPRQMSGVRCYFFDSIGVPTPEVMERECGGGEKWQEQMTKRWIERLALRLSSRISLVPASLTPAFSCWIAHRP